jgi:hypothetical protein
MAWSNYSQEALMRKICISLLTLLLVLGFAGAVLAQKYVPDPDVYSKIKGAYQPIGLVAGIGYNRDLGGYFIKNNPRYGFGNKIILNQNYEVLSRLARRGKVVTISCRVSPIEFRASHVYIEAIDGRPYHGRHAPLVRIY